MSRPVKDLEKDKFDSDARVRVSIEQNNASSQDQDVKVINTDSEPVPVKIIDPSDAIDLTVSVSPAVEIDDSTPVDVNVTNTSVDVNITALDGDGDLGVKVQNTDDIDVNVTNASINTNATIQNANLDVNLTDLNGSNRLPVSVDNQPTVTVDDSTPVDVNVTNTVATNATIQNSALNVYQYVHDGSAWRFQLADTNGKAINLDHTYYTSSEITALGSSTDINLWLAAYNDSMLQMKYVETFNAEFEETVYYQHPSLGNGSKCLRLIYQYSTENSQTVVESIYASVEDWSFTDEIQGSVSISHSNVSAADPSSTIAIHTRVADLSITDNTFGSVTLTLSGTNASLYHIHNTTAGTFGSSLPFISGNVYQIHTASNFSGSSYSHSITVSATGDTFGVSDSTTISLVGTYVAPGDFENTKFIHMPSASSTSSADFELTSTEKSVWPSLGSGTNYYPLNSEAYSMSLWIKGSNTVESNKFYNLFSMTNISAAQIKLFFISGRLRYTYTRQNAAGAMQFEKSSSSVLNGNWNNIIITKSGSTGVPLSAFTLYINGVEITSYDGSSVDTYGTSTYHEDRTIVNTEIGGAVRSATTGNYLARSSQALSCDEFIFFNKELSTNNGGVNEITELYNYGAPVDPSELSFSSNVDSYFRMGDNTNDSVSNVTFVDNENTSRQFERKHTGNQAIEDLNVSEILYLKGAYANLYALEASTRTDQSTDFQINVTGQSTTEKSLWPSLGGGANKMPSVNDDLAVAFWFKSSSYVGSGRNCLFYQSSATGASSNFIACYVYKSGSNLLFEFFYGKAGTALKGRQYSITYVEDEWNHIVISKGAGVPSSSNVAFHINGGSAAGSSNISVGSMSTTDFDSTTVNNLEFFTYPRWLGSNYNRNESKPIVDEFYAINKSLTQSEVEELLDSSYNPVKANSLSFNTNIDSHFRFGDLFEDDVSTNKTYDGIDTDRYLEKVGTHDGNIVNLRINNDLYVPGSGDFVNQYYARSNTTNSSVVDYRLNGTEKSLWPSLSTGTNTYPPMSTAWAMSFWIYMPTTGTGLSNSYRECLIKQQVGTAQGGMQIFMRGTNTLEVYIGATSAGNYIYGSISTGFSYDAWNLVTINYNGSYDLYVRANNTSTAGGNGASGTASTIDSQLSNATINNLEVMSFVHTPAGGSSVARANRFYRIDEIITYNRLLTQSERDELWNNGGILNPDDLSFSSTIISHFRFGDGSNDSITNFHAYDENDSTRYFEPVTAGTRDFTTH